MTTWMPTHLRLTWAQDVEPATVEGAEVCSALIRSLFGGCEQGGGSYGEPSMAAT
ncbi:hypothetical protein [Micromonospora lutea]|uniref:hypothetical protein n=1 Tax=Micromonospora lutea TaxID=419825 RepID=UPI001EF306EE|nr:hypothetical protein [Micromonospora lutea]